MRYAIMSLAIPVLGLPFVKAEDDWPPREINFGAADDLFPSPDGMRRTSNSDGNIAGGMTSLADKIFETADPKGMVFSDKIFAKPHVATINTVKQSNDSKNVDNSTVTGRTKVIRKVVSVKQMQATAKHAEVEHTTIPSGVELAPVSNPSVGTSTSSGDDVSATLAPVPTITSSKDAGDSDSVSDTSSGTISQSGSDTGGEASKGSLKGSFRSSYKPGAVKTATPGETKIEGVPTLEEQLDQLLNEITSETIPATVVEDEISADKYNDTSPVDWWRKNTSMNWLAWLAVIHMVFLAFWAAHEIRRAQQRAMQLRAAHNRKKLRNKSANAVPKVPPAPLFLPMPIDFASGQDMLSQHPPCGIEPDTDPEMDPPSNLGEVLRKFGNSLGGPTFWNPEVQEVQKNEDGSVAVPRLNLDVIERDTSSVPRYIPSNESCASSDVCSTLHDFDSVCNTQRSFLDTSRSMLSSILHDSPVANMRFPQLFTRPIRSPSAQPILQDCNRELELQNEQGKGRETWAQKMVRERVEENFRSPHSQTSSASSGSSGSVAVVQNRGSEPVKVHFPNGLVINTSKNLRDVHDIIHESYTPPSSASRSSRSASEQDVLSVLRNIKP